MCVFDNNNKLKGMSSIAAFSYQIKAESEPSSKYLSTKLIHFKSINMTFALHKYI